MKPTILFLEQQSWRGGAQIVLQGVLDTLKDEFLPIVAFPGDGAFRRHLTESGIETFSYPLGSYRPGKKSIFEMLSFILRTLMCAVKLTRFILTRNVRLVYINGPRCLPAGMLAARLTCRPTLFHLHITLTRRIDILLASRLARWTTQVVACSQAAATSLLAECPNLKPKTTVVYNYVDAPSAKPSYSESRPHAPFTIGIVGRVTPGKGHHVLLEAFSKMEASLQSNCRLILVGAPAPGCPEDDSYLEQLKVRSQELGISGKILWAGHQANVNPYYQMIDILAVPSVRFIEGLSLVTLEAMQHGIPVIAPNTGGTPEIVEHEINGLLVPPGDVDALARALERLIKDTGLYLRLSAAARASIDSRFSKELFVSTFRRLARALCPTRFTSHVLKNETETGR